MPLLEQPGFTLGTVTLLNTALAGVYLLTNWTQVILYTLLTKSAVYVRTKYLGTVILIWFALVVVRRKKVCAVVGNGQV